MKENDWEDVLSAASRLQGIIPDTVLVGGTAAAIFAKHRISYDADHVVNDLRDKYEKILNKLESVAGWETNRITPPVLILGDLYGIETGIRQLIRSEPLETTEVIIKEQKITVPTPEEILRIKAALILKRNATRDYVDFVALFDFLGREQGVNALQSLDRLYPQKNGNSPYQQLAIQLADPRPKDVRKGQLKDYKNIIDKYNSWEKVEIICKNIAYYLSEDMDNDEEQSTGISM